MFSYWIWSPDQCVLTCWFFVLRHQKTSRPILFVFCLAGFVQLSVCYSKFLKSLGLKSRNRLWSQIDETHNLLPIFPSFPSSSLDINHYVLKVSSSTQYLERLSSSKMWFKRKNHKVGILKCSKKTKESSFWANNFWTKFPWLPRELPAEKKRNYFQLRNKWLLNNSTSNHDQSLATVWPWLVMVGCVELFTSQLFLSWK